MHEQRAQCIGEQRIWKRGALLEGATGDYSGWVPLGIGAKLGQQPASANARVATDPNKLTAPLACGAPCLRQLFQLAFPPDEDRRGARRAWSIDHTPAFQRTLVSRMLD
jgi:hypothetical protein